MARYVIRRIMLMIPTMFLVLTIAFLLSKMVPGDAAVSMLSMQGVDLESSNKHQEYQRQYKALGLDKPIFYFSVLPDFYPENIHIISEEVIRDQTQELLRQKAQYIYINDYLLKRKKFLSRVTQDTFFVKDDTLRLASKLAFETDIPSLKILFENIPLPNGTETKQSYNILKSSFSTMKKEKAELYFPSFFWHGSDNQFHIWLCQILKGNLGISMKDGRMVSEKILTAFNWTLILIFLNLLVTGVIAIPAGLYAGYKENSYIDMVNNIIWLVLYSIPVFWLASLMIVYFTSERFGSWMNIFPTSGTWFIPEGQNLMATIKEYMGQMVLPVICLAANDIAQLSRIVRNNVINQKSRLYVTFAQAKGLSSLQTLFRHILPNVLIPIITIMGARVPAGLSGALVIEVIFNIPGMGRLMFDSIHSADWNVVFGVLIVISFFTMIFMLLTDILYAIFSPGAKKSLHESEG